MSLEMEARRFVSKLQKVYLEERDIDEIISVLNKETSWIGTGDHEICHSLDEAYRALSEEKKECPVGFVLEDSSYDTISLSEDICVVYGKMYARSLEKSVADIHDRFSAVCKRTDQGMKLLHLHLSRPDIDQRNQEYYTKTSAVYKRRQLELTAERTKKALLDREQELEMFTENIPAGMHKCLDDPNLTIIKMNENFLGLFGYTREEVEERFNNQFIHMIHEEDRDRTARIMFQQLAQGDEIELEYRVVRKDGQIRWILDRGKRKEGDNSTHVYYCVMLDITDQKRQREALRLSLERHQVIMDQTTDIIFEWNIREDTLSFSHNWKKKFGYDPIEEKISCHIPQSLNIHSSDMESFLKIMNDTARGVPYSETEFRIRDIYGNFTWCRIRATTQFNGNGEPVRAVGVIIDIEDEKKVRQLLMQQAQVDSLTGLLNKAAVRNRVEELILGAECQSGMLYLIDLDDFKSINDRFGHLCGDEVLTELAVKIKDKFGVRDIVGRIGGDEFLVFQPGITEEQAREVAQGLLESFREIKVNRRREEVYGSIGASYYPTQGEEFNQLYAQADKALYYVKNTGKGGYSIYNTCMEVQESDGTYPHSAISTVIDSEKKKLMDVEQKLAQYCFRILYSSKDTALAVKQLLETIGRNYDMSRVYIFENTADGMCCRNTFEWCQTEITPRIDGMGLLSYQEDLKGFLEAFDEDGTIYCHDLPETNPGLLRFMRKYDVKSMLQYAIHGDGIFQGVLGFDECRNQKLWTKEQIASLSLTAHVLGVFLIKLRYREGLKDGGTER